VTQPPLGEVVGLRDLIRQSTVHQGVILAAKLLAPNPILDEALEHFI